MQKCAFALLEHACDVVRCLSYLYKSLGTGVRPLNEDELLYTRLGKRGVYSPPEKRYALTL